MKTLTIKDIPETTRELEQKEMESISGGMMKLTEHQPAPADTGVTWVPEGTVKVYLAGVQIQ